MLFAIFLIDPTSLFTNALPADGTDLPMRAFYTAYENQNCSDGKGDIYSSNIITSDICYSMSTPSDPDSPDVPLISGNKSGHASNANIDIAKYNCIVAFYAGTECVGFLVGKTETIGPDRGSGPCVNFGPLPKILPILEDEANSVKLTCKPVEV